MNRLRKGLLEKNMVSEDNNSLKDIRPRRRGRLRRNIRTYRSRLQKNVAQNPGAFVAIPSFFTLMNLLCGFAAITQIYEGSFDRAAWLILLAAFFDALDGMMARLTNSTSLFGVELDSLSDIVSFGVAPAFLVYVFGLKELEFLGLIIAALPALCGAVRLARFNVTVEKDGHKPEYFCGLPIPVQAAAIVTLILSLESLQSLPWLQGTSVNTLPLLIPVVAVLAGLMVSNIQFDALPQPSLAYTLKHPFKVMALLLGVVITIIFQQIGLLICIYTYVLYGIGNGAIHIYKMMIKAPGQGSV